MCDGVEDCIDGSDEHNCTECKEDAFKCVDGSKCILKNKQCDAVVDCLGDQSDEENCTTCSSHAGPTWKCLNSTQCISETKLCDGIKDCLYESDERNCPICRTNEVKCKDGLKCIPVRWIGDNITDCHDGSDVVWRETATEGVVTSPLYPTISYPQNMDWKVIIEPVNADFISIIFTDLQIPDDFVHVFDGDSTDSTKLATLTGYPALPIQIVSSGKKVMIHMTSDGGAQDVGFSLNYAGMKGN